MSKKQKPSPVYLDFPEKEKTVFKVFMLIFLGIIAVAVLFGR